MALLSLKSRQKCLKELGFYEGEIDGILGPKTKEAYRLLQNKYFIRKADKDGIYGINTDILLRNAYKCKDLKYFDLKEFRCGCNGKYCTGYPYELDDNLLINIDDMRIYINKPFIITSGLRCEKHNKLCGGVQSSKHKLGKAIDFYVKGYTSLPDRERLINYWINTYHESNYGYCNGYGRTKTSISNPYSKTMSNATHIEVI